MQQIWHFILTRLSSALNNLLLAKNEQFRLTRGEKQEELGF